MQATVWQPRSVLDELAEKRWQERKQKALDRQVSKRPGDTVGSRIEKEKEQRKAFAESDQKIKFLRLREAIHPLLRYAVRVSRWSYGGKIYSNSIKEANKKIKKTTHVLPKEIASSVISAVREIPKKERTLGNVIAKTKENIKGVNDSKRPIIFAVTHIGKYDIEVVSEIVKQAFNLLCADQEFQYHNFDDYLLRATGVTYVDLDDEEDKKAAIKNVIKLLKQKQCVMWFPEGIWNFSADNILNCLINPLPLGIATAAKEGDALILPIAVDQFEDKKFQVEFGDFIDVRDYKDAYSEDKETSKKGKIEVVNVLRDAMATLKWKMWENNPILDRNSIPDNYWKEFKKKRIAEWNGFDEDNFTASAVEKRGFKLHVRPDEVFEHTVVESPDVMKLCKKPEIKLPIAS